MGREVRKQEAGMGRGRERGRVRRRPLKVWRQSVRVISLESTITTTITALPVDCFHSPDL